MNTELKPVILIGVFIVACLAVGIWLVAGNSIFPPPQTPLPNETGLIPSAIYNQTIPAQNISRQKQWPDFHFTIDARVPETPRYIPLYKGTMSDDDLKSQLKYLSKNLSIQKKYIPCKEDAPVLAERALEPYGGLPHDAVLSVVMYESQSTRVVYKRQINGLPVTGEGDVDGIGVLLGENGELLELRKQWRTLEKTGEVVPVITPDKAVEKLVHFEWLRICQSSKPVYMNDVRLGYYEEPWKIREIILEPVWIFTPSGPGCELQVYARQFADFTATPASGTVPLNVTFTDTSDTSPTAWYWDFNDGTNSSLRNPVHEYRMPGTYNVTLKAWNDWGSDTMVKEFTFTGTPASPVIANSTAIPKVSG